MQEGDSKMEIKQTIGPQIDKLAAASSIVIEEEVELHPTSNSDARILSYGKLLFLGNTSFKRKKSFYQQFKNNVYLETEDGNTIGAFLYEPESITEETLMFVVCHGKGADRHEAGLFGDLDDLVVNNVCLLLIDYRDFADSTGEYTIEGVNLDVLAGIQFMKKRFRRNSVFLVGHSLGATVVIEYGRYATLHRQDALPDKIYAIAPFSTTVSICKDFLIYRILTFFITRLESIIESSFNYNSLAAAKVLGSRLVVIHGVNDRIVNIRHGEMIAKEANCTLKRTSRSHLNIFSDPQTWDYIFEHARSSVD